MAREVTEKDGVVVTMLQHCNESDSNDHVCGHTDPEDKKEEDCGFYDAVTSHLCKDDCSAPCPITEMRMDIEDLEAAEPGEPRAKAEPQAQEEPGDGFLESGDSVEGIDPYDVTADLDPDSEQTVAALETELRADHRRND